jgi:hypothetical protein
MSAPEGSERGESGDGANENAPPAAGDSVLANLPRTRPQRSSPRRAAARRSSAAAANGTVAAAEQADTPATPRRAPKAAAKPRRRKAATGATAATRTRAKTGGSSARARPQQRRTPRGEPVPAQGFESDGEGLRGAVHPPGGAELFASAVEIVGELTKSGVAGGERLVKDLLSRLSPS